ncbi:maleylpyruvate isomerase family mycothiol-dependent enzyme [Georgenia faecalis]|uniref:Maleylpyruvate isomerase family mycothiol-dependent enzyme n=1 Tax=Georgenia faecalis TaxID=2483799 RepID=A0ABV9D7N2_9MICO|nr:maleylpyruvate isomerase family mycothiol-dependent enzyme [Georgenia faecalis]
MTDDRFGPRLDVRPLFPAERTALVALLGTLGPEDWAREAVPGWTVKDLTAHVLHDYLRRLSGARDGHGAPLPPGPTLAARINAANEEFVAVARQLSAPVLVDLIAHLGPQLDRVWDDVDLDGRSGVDVSWAGEGTPAWLDVAREYTEFWVHQQQVRDAVAQPGFDTPDVMGPVIATFARALPRTVASVERPVGTSVELRVTGPAGGAWTAVRRPDGWALGEAAGGAAAAEVVLDQDTFWRLATRRIAVDDARARAVLRGDAELGRAVTTLLAIVR